MATVPETVTRSGMQAAFGAPQPGSGTSVALPIQPKRRFVAWLFTAWAVLSLAWTGFILMDLYNKAAAQADMSREVEDELDSASCTHSPCPAALRTTPQEEWSNIAQTYLQLGYVPILEWTVVPPVALLAIGIGGIVMMRRLRVAARA